MLRQYLITNGYKNEEQAQQKVIAPNIFNAILICDYPLESISSIIYLQDEELNKLA